PPLARADDPARCPPRPGPRSRSRPHGRRRLAVLGQGERLPMAEALDAHFPGPRTSSSRVTSPATRAYNRIAWAAGDMTRWWWPDPDSDDEAGFWPPTVPRAETLDAFVAAFATLGYAAGSGEEPEPGFGKVA